MTIEQMRSAPDEAQENGSQLEKYGITKTHVDVFSYKEYRYSNLKDAVAQAKRDEARREI